MTKENTDQSKRFLQTSRGTYALLRVLYIVAGAGSILILAKETESFRWEPAAQAVLDAYAMLLDRLLGPLEDVINWVLAQLNFDVRLGPLFKPYLVVALVISAAASRSAKHHSALGWRLRLVFPLVYLPLAVLLGFAPDQQVGSMTHSEIAFFVTVAALMALAVMFSIQLPFLPSEENSWSRGTATEIAAILIAVLAFIIFNAGLKATS